MNEVLKVIRQGDQYLLPFRITDNGTVLTPENVTDLRVKVGGKALRYSDGGLQFRDEEWLFPVTQAETMAMRDSVRCAAQYKRGGEIITGPNYRVIVDDSIFEDVFDG